MTDEELLIKYSTIIDGNLTYLRGNYDNYIHGALNKDKLPLSLRKMAEFIERRLNQKNAASLATMMLAEIKQQLEKCLLGVGGCFVNLRKVEEEKIPEYLRFLSPIKLLQHAIWKLPKDTKEVETKWDELLILGGCCLIRYQQILVSYDTSNFFFAPAELRPITSGDGKPLTPEFLKSLENEKPTISLNKHGDLVDIAFELAGILEISHLKNNEIEKINYFEQEARNIAELDAKISKEIHIKMDANLDYGRKIAAEKSKKKALEKFAEIKKAIKDLFKNERCSEGFSDDYVLKYLKQYKLDIKDPATQKRYNSQYFKRQVSPLIEETRNELK